MRIQNNIMAMNTHRMYTTNNNNIQKSAEKLSSGYRINRAGDDAAGLAISEKMRSQIRGLNMASKNSQDAISLVQTAEGALQEVHSMLQRMNELAVQSATGTNQEFDRLQLAKEFNQLKREINDIAEQTTFNNMKILDGSLSSEGPERSAQTAGLLMSNNESAEAAAADSAKTISPQGSPQMGGVTNVTPSGANVEVPDAWEIEPATSSVSDVNVTGDAAEATFNINTAGVSTDATTGLINKITISADSGNTQIEFDLTDAANNDFLTALAAGAGLTSGDIASALTSTNLGVLTAKGDGSTWTVSGSDSGLVFTRNETDAAVNMTGAVISFDGTDINNGNNVASTGVTPGTADTYNEAAATFTLDATLLTTDDVITFGDGSTYTVVGTELTDANSLADAIVAVHTQFTNNGSSDQTLSLKMTATTAGEDIGKITIDRVNDNNAEAEYNIDPTKLNVGDVITISGSTGSYTVVTADVDGTNSLAQFAAALANEFTGYSDNGTGTTGPIKLSMTGSPGDVMGIMQITPADAEATGTYSVDLASLNDGDIIEFEGQTYTFSSTEITNETAFAAKLVELGGLAGVTYADDGSGAGEIKLKMTAGATEMSNLEITSNGAPVANESDRSYLEIDRNKMRIGDVLELTTADGTTHTATWNGKVEDFVAELQTTLTGSTLKNNTLIIEGQLLKQDAVSLTPVDTPDEEYGTMRIQVGALEHEQLNIEVKSMNTAGLKLDDSNLETQDSAGAAITATRSAVNVVSEQRALLGAMQNRLEHKISNLDNTAENLQAAEARIRDVDIAKEMTNFTKNNILAQAATAMLAQANAAPQGVLSLLQ